MTEKPEINITYCGGCGYEPRALLIAAEIGREFGIRAELHKTVGGVFEIDLGEERIFSKTLLGRFPEEGEILKIMQTRLSGVEPMKNIDEAVRKWLEK